jgi:hypothetical protein
VLRIRRAQREALARAEVEDFVRALADHLEESFPAAVRRIDRDELLASIRSWVDRAVAWGFETERQASAFVDVAFVLGDGFDRQPWARAVLEDRTLPARVRIDRLLALATAREAS